MEVNRAATAEASAASEPRTGQAQRIAQVPQQGRVRFLRYLPDHTIDRQFDHRRPPKDVLVARATTWAAAFNGPSHCFIRPLTHWEVRVWPVLHAAVKVGAPPDLRPRQRYLRARGRQGIR